MSTLTSFQSLLLDYEPRPIRSEGASRKALRHVEKLMRLKRAMPALFWPAFGVARCDRPTHVCT